MNLTPRELAHVLVGLRHMQAVSQTQPGWFEDHDSLDGHTLMDAEEIDELCEKINVVESPLVYQICLSGCEDEDEGVIWAILDDLQSNTIGNLARELGALFSVTEVGLDAPGIDYDCQEPEQMETLVHYLMKELTDA